MKQKSTNTPKRLRVVIEEDEVELTSLDGWSMKLSPDDAQSLVLHLVAALRTLKSGFAHDVVH